MDINKTIIVIDKEVEDMTYREIVVLNLIISYISKYFNIKISKENIYLSFDIIHKICIKNETKMENDRMNMHSSFLEVEDLFDKNKLIYYSKESNPIFSEKIKQAKSNIFDLLWMEYEKKFHEENAIRFEDEMRYIAHEIGWYKKANIIEIFFNHQLIFNQIHTQYVPNYPLIGRGFCALGATHRILNRRYKKTDLFRIHLPLCFVAGEDEYIQFLYAKEILNHEFFGHIRNSLKDHYSDDSLISSSDCLMKCEHDVVKILQLSIKDMGIYLCENCWQKVKENEQRIKDITINA